jgi:hypothetical protein
MGAKELTKSAVERGIEIGDLLIAKKNKMRHGDWIPWVEANCNFVRQRATAFMRLAEANGTREFHLEKVPSIRAALAMIEEPKEEMAKEPKAIDWHLDKRIEELFEHLKQARATILMLRSTNQDSESADYYLKMAKEHMLETINKYMKEY